MSRLPTAPSGWSCCKAASGSSSRIASACGAPTVDTLSLPQIAGSVASYVNLGITWTWAYDVCMTHVTQISAQVSASAKQLLDEYSAVSGIKKSRIVEDALWFYVRARQELPESAIVPARLVVSARGAAALEQSLAQPPPATPALVRLMRTLESPDAE